MSDEVVVDGERYISSRRAAELCGYVQDYVGQLARSGKVDARRVAGLWYVSARAIQDHKVRTDAAAPVPRQHAESRIADSITGSDGLEYVSANRASRISGYNQDYIGQLARSAQIPAQQIGNRWYVFADALLKHKREKDALLAAVQADSVGLLHRTPPATATSVAVPTHFEYRAEIAPLLPELSVDASIEPEQQADERPSNNDVHRVHIRRFRTESVRHTARRADSDMTSKNLVAPAITVVALCLLAAGSYLLVPMGHGVWGSLSSITRSQSQAAAPSLADPGADKTEVKPGFDAYAILGALIRSHIEYRRYPD